MYLNKLIACSIFILPFAAYASESHVVSGSDYTVTALSVSVEGVDDCNGALVEPLTGVIQANFALERRGCTIQLVHKSTTSLSGKAINVIWYKKTNWRIKGSAVESREIAKLEKYTIK